MKYYIPSLLWALLILFLSTKGGVNLPSSWLDFISLDKIGHLIFYGIFTILLCRDIAQSDKHLGKKKMILVLSIAIGYGILMEILQKTFFPERYFEIPDIIANIIGSIIGFYLYKKFLNTEGVKN